jgi:ABC-2 type transport system ATP-binding protein
LDRPVSLGSPASRPAGSDLTLEGVVRRWRSRRGDTVVLKGLDLHAPGGTTTWIGGANGAGKTTLLRTAAGIIAPEQGSVRFGGVDAERDRRRFQRLCTFVAAGDSGLYARITVRFHLEFQAKLTLVPKHERSDRIKRSIRDFGLAELADRRTDRLSLGQRQRVRLALAFLHDPMVALLDEPASSLDDEGLRILRGAVGRVVAQGGVVVWCSPPTERGVIASDQELRIEDGALVPDAS